MDQTPPPQIQPGLSGTSSTSSSTSRKETDFIDHDLPLQLLTPSYMRDTHNYIIDFMDSNPLLFPTSKNVSQGPTSHNGSSLTTQINQPVPRSVGGDDVDDGRGSGVAYGSVKGTDTVSLTSDLHFPSSIFHYRPTPADVTVRNAIAASVDESALNPLNTQSTTPLSLVMDTGRNNNHQNQNKLGNMHTSKHSGEYITMSGEYLGTGGIAGDRAVGVNSETVVNQSTAGDDAAAVQQFLLGSAPVSLDDDTTDLIESYTRHVANARKVLPHKKRISQKLRVSLNGAENTLPPPLVSVHQNNKLPAEQPLNVPIYSCEICGNTAESQLQFFAHLKQHYEPSTQDTILAAMKTSLDDLEPVESQKLCEAEKKPSTDNVDQVFNDVHLNFPDFSTVEEAPISHVMDAAVDVNNELNSNDINKCINYVAPNHTQPPPLKRTVEVEFSDSEDMLEGIRNVVDKETIEDTCEALDLITSSAMRSSWFSNDHFGGLNTYKNKSYNNDVPFTEPLPPMPMMTATSLAARRKQSRAATPLPPPLPPLPPAAKLLPYQKSEASRRDNLNMPLPRVINGADEDEDAVVMPSNTAAFYNHAVPPPSLSNGVPQLRSTTMPTDLLQPLRVTQFEYTEDTNGAITIGNITDITLQPVECDLESTVEAEQEVFCKEEPNSHEYDGGGGGGGEHDDDDCKMDNSKAEENFNKLADEYADNDTRTSSVLPAVSDANKKKKHICMKCDRGFNSHNALRYHLNTHTGTRPYRCEICDKSFIAMHALKNHKRIHSNEKPYKCQICKRDFRQWGDLNYHTVSLHTLDKSHQCEFCGKSFSRKYSLVLHRRIHTSEKNYKCDYCDKSFRANNYLQEHRRLHTGEKPHACKVCSKSFRMHSDMRRHERIHERPEKEKNKESKKKDAVAKLLKEKKKSK